MAQLNFHRFLSVINITFRNSNQILHKDNIRKAFDNNNVELLKFQDNSPKSVEIECISERDNLTNLTNELEKFNFNINISPKYFVDQNQQPKLPWFPQNILELYQYCNYVTGCSEIESDHVGFTDKLYRERRQEIVNKTFSQKPNQPLPHINYTREENQTWSKVFESVTKLHKIHACKEYNQNMELFMEKCGYSADKIPQIDEVSTFLKNRTGFSLYPVAGFLSPRDFLASLAFRVFRSTQYLRHPSQPLFTPEPDVCHELIGHAPMFADADFAEFSQEIGLASLGASDDYVEKLAGCYWFSIEFGLCRQDGLLKAYGAGLLSSYGELEHCFTTTPILKQFIPENAAEEPYNLKEYQPIYYVAESFTDGTEKVRQFAKTIQRPFNLKYNKETESITIIE